MIEVVAIVLGVFCVAIFVAHAVDALSRALRPAIESCCTTLGGPPVYQRET